MSEKTVKLKILRSEGAKTPQYWEEFDVPYISGMNVISCLMAIQRNPINASGETVKPVVWECNCLEEVCGACTMVINGQPRQSCSALVDKLEQPIVLQPLTKFPRVRDLMVDRKRMFDAFRKVKAWVPIDGTYDLGAGGKVSEEEQQEAYAFSRCMVCGCCMESCPQYHQQSDFIGPAPLAQAHLFNNNGAGKLNKTERLRQVMDKGGVQDCGNAQNCVKVCPKEIPITDAIAELGRETSKLLLKDIFG